MQNEKLELGGRRRGSVRERTGGQLRAGTGRALTESRRGESTTIQRGGGCCRCSGSWGGAVVLGVPGVWRGK